MENPVRPFFGALLMLLVCLPGWGHARTNQAYYNLGVYAYEAGDDAGALRYFGKALEEDPADLPSRYFLGKTYIRMGEYSQAENALREVLDHDPDMAGLKSDWAYLQFKLEKFPSAAKVYTDLADADPGDAFANYYAGISLYKSGRFGRAVEYLVRAADQSPTVRDNATFFAGISSFKSGNLEKAVQCFADLRDHGRTEEMRDHAAAWLSEIESRKSREKPYSLYVKLAFQYDDNVTLEPVNDDNPADEDDVVSILYFSGRVDLLRSPKCRAGIGYSHYENRHSDLSEYDLTAAIGTLYATYRTYPAVWSLTYYPSYYQLDGDGFLMRHHIKPELVIAARDDLLLRAAYRYYGNNHIADGERSGHANLGEFEAIYGFGSRKSYVSALIDFEDNRASHPDYDYARAGMRLGASVDILERLTLKATGEAFDKTYDNTDSFFGKKRNDVRYTGTLELLARTPAQWLTVSGEIEYIRNDSNIDDYEYREFTTTVAVSASY